MLHLTFSEMRKSLADKGVSKPLISPDELMRRCSRLAGLLKRKPGEAGPA
jgi:hypothetical protein